MLDIKVVRAQPDKVKAAMKARNKDMDDLIDQVLDIDVQRREITAKAESMKAQQNLTSKKIPQIKKEGGDVSVIMAEMKQLADQVKAYNAQLSELEPRSPAPGSISTKDWAPVWSGPSSAFSSIPIPNTDIRKSCPPIWSTAHP